MKLKIYNIFSWLNPAKKRHICFLLLLLFFTQVGYGSKENKEKKIYLVFRFDDYSARSNTELELKITETFRKNNMAFTMGVIPFEGAGDLTDPSPQGNLPLGQEKGNILRNACNKGVVEVALHGYAHQSHSTEYIASEFKGLAIEKQKDKILKGKKYLEGITGKKITTFIPPWNQFDYNTLRVLEDLQFKNISADIFGSTNNTTTIQLLPNSCGLKKIKEAVKAARVSSDKKSIIVALFHAYDFIEDNETEGKLDIEQFSNLINWVADQTDVKVLTINQMISKLPQDYLKEKYIINQKIIAYSLKTPSFVRSTPNYIYASESYFKFLRWKTITFYIIILVFTSATTYILTNRLNIAIMKKSIVTIISLFLLMIMISYCLYNPQFGYNSGIIFTILTGIISTPFYLLIKIRSKF